MFMLRGWVGRHTTDINDEDEEQLQMTNPEEQLTPMLATTPDENE